MRYYIIAGEASGDLHGSFLIKALRQKDTETVIACWGGDLMQQAGGTLVKHYSELAFMGFVEVLKHLGTIVKNLEFCRKDIQSFQPDVLVLIDYPGFNLRIAAWAKKAGIKVVYYISPQVWAWKENRVKQIKRDVDKMLVILPFEIDFYKKWNLDAVYVGHPLVEAIKADRKENKVITITNKPIAAILPGSRVQEIKLKLPVMLEMIKHFPQFDFVIAQASSTPDNLYQEIAAGYPVLFVKNQTYNLLKQAEIALVTSGTATLETALFGVPQVVCYKGNAISFWLAKKLVKVKYISLVNLIMDNPVVKELIQDELTEANLKSAIGRLLNDKTYQEELNANYAALWHQLGDKQASVNAAEEIFRIAVKR